MIYIPVRSVQMDAHAGHDAAGTALSLHGVGLRHPTGLQALHISDRIKLNLLHQAGIDHVDAIFNSNGRLGQIRAEYNFTNVSRNFHKYTVLLFGRKTRVQRDNNRML